MHYKISYQQPQQHFIDFELTIDCPDDAAIKLQLPAWRPGRYSLQNFAKNIQRFEILNTSSGEPVSFKKASKDCWEVDVVNVKQISVHYNYFAVQMDAGGSWLDETQLYINFVNCGLQVLEREQEAYTVELILPDEYRVATSLPALSKHQFEARNFDVLADSPLIASDSLQHESYQVDGSTFHIWIQGNVKPDWDKLLTDFERFTRTQMTLFGGFPHKDFHFMLQILPYKHYHGVEHHESTVITLGPDEEFGSDTMYHDLIGVSSHELFHVWNVKAIRPVELQPYDFSKESYFRTGFVAEGLTTYYGDYLVARDGTIKEEQYVDDLNKMLKRHFENQGRYNLSVADSSYDLWLDGYEKGIPNRKVSIYIEGALAAFILDTELRQQSGNKKSLDDVVRLLWERFGQTGIGYSEEDYRKAVEEVAGKPMQTYFETCIEGKGGLEKQLQAAFSYVGCSLDISLSAQYQERDFGFRIAADSLRVTDIVPNSPAELLGYGDEVVAVNGRKVTSSNFSLLVQRAEELDLTIFRNEHLKKIRLKRDGKDYFSTYEVKIEDQEKYQKWMKA
ncbi:M61 family peptidase [Limibacter armeniacum]|uniref:M61 family metallopeptidase n=1 Tax=Limibacter armeniacum TaxID=466084 RepID=UPI002FE681AD